MTTFKVSDVKRARNPLPTAKSMLELITTKIRTKPESCCKLADNLMPVKSWSTQNSFIEAVHTAYDNHYPLVLSPDIIWQCVAQGFAVHVNKNPEILLQVFDAHQRENKLVLQTDDFVNDWEQVLGTFSNEIRKKVGDEIHDLLNPDFSTTGPVEKVASQIVLMNTFKEYFDYELYTACGIPSITLEGTVEDWKKLREKTLSLSHFDFQWWTDAVEPILDEFVEASSGVVNKEFWQSFYKMFDGSGGPYITGWVVKLFPYLGSRTEKMRPNSTLLSCGRSQEFLVTTVDFPPGAISTPFVWQHFEEELEMFFYTGFLGVGQDKKTLALKPVIGWAVVDKEEEEKSKMEPRGLIV